MSHPSETPPGNRPPNARVFRPFTGGAGTAGQGSQPSSTPGGMQRRPGQPFRPFIGAQVQAASVAPLEAPPSEPAIVAAATVVEPVAESVPFPTPTYHEPEPAPIAHEAWERYVAPEPEPQHEREPVAQEPIAAEPPRVVHNPEITVEVPQIEHAEFRIEAEPSSYPAPTLAKSMPPITVEVPAIPSEEAMAAIRDVAHEGDLWEAAYSSVPAEGPSSNVVIDEVEAAFSETAPSSNDNGRTDEALVAAMTLEAIARRLRDGEIDIRPARGANMSKEESALATVLAALLANR